jgi:hypothetical protein
MPVFMFLGFSFWVPQIVHSVHHDARDGLCNAYLFTTSITRLFMPLYFFGCPHNFITTVKPMTPSYQLCMVLSGWMALQVGAALAVWLTWWLDVCLARDASSAALALGHRSRRSRLASSRA